MAAQGRIVGIVAWSLVVLLAIGIVVVAMMGRQQAARASDLGEALVQVAQTAGVEDWTPAAPVTEPGEEGAPEMPAPEAQALTAGLLGDAAVRADVQERVQDVIRTLRLDVAAATDAVAVARNATSAAQAEAASLAQRAQEQEARLDTLTQEVAEGQDALATVKADLEQAAQRAEAARLEAEEQIANLEQALERTTAEMAETIARLQADVEALHSPEPEIDAEGEEWAEESLADDDLDDELDEDLEEGRVIGTSQMFSRLRYTEGQSLVLHLLDGQVLTYQDVPAIAVDRLAASGDRLDMVFRFRIQGEFKSVPPDSVVIRKYWRWQRRHKARATASLVVPELPVPEETEDEPESE